MTSTLGCPIVCTLGGTMWPPMPPCGWTCETSSRDKHHVEWEGQKLLMRSLNYLERNTEVVYRERLVKRENDRLAADSREAAAKELPPDRQVGRAERQAGAMPVNLDIASSSSQADLYPNWIRAPVTRPWGSNQPKTVQNTQAGGRPKLHIGGGVGH